MSMVISPLSTWTSYIRRISKYCDYPGTSVDVVVTEIGIFNQPNRQDLIEHFKGLDVPQYTIKNYKKKHTASLETGPIQYGGVKWLR